jgi:riboflavin biosynthesis pyrimidine reductase
MLATVSRDLDIPAPDLAQRYTRDILAVTPGDAPGRRVKELERGGVEVARAGTGPYVTAEALLTVLAERGLTTVYSLAGPRMLHTLAAGRQLHRLYLTVAHKLTGGEDYDTLTRGPVLEPAPGFRPVETYWDPAAPEGAGQLLQVLDPVNGEV